MRTRKSAEDRKAEIVEAALLIADRLGPERLTIDSVAEEIGLTQPGVFRHFPKKQNLWEAVATRIGTMMEARWKAAHGSGDTPIDEIQALVEAQLRLIQGTPAIPAILFSRELHARNEGLRTIFHGLLTRFHRMIAEHASRARETGLMRPDVDPQDAAFLVIALLQGLVVRWSISGRSFDLAEEGARLAKEQLRLMTTRTAGDEP
ncbi:TetR/AcrR family transcriptional regulator [Salinarimonas ramus]|uniref:TetR family transcriptional regulator n=1 Tax=Salinarimonas ramus TaxID=690164 RepID=A0A917V9A2_9HYPH|nr:TetR/AcrR family transcriptional regulator [Salinarimonas ramus]GGK51099.1 TetR family transcriptional regulator [Salinarimonas ramus]